MIKCVKCSEPDNFRKLEKIKVEEVLCTILKCNNCQYEMCIGYGK